MPDANLGYGFIPTESGDVRFVFGLDGDCILAFNLSPTDCLIMVQRITQAAFEAMTPEQRREVEEWSNKTMLEALACPTTSLN